MAGEVYPSSIGIVSVFQKIQSRIILEQIMLDNKLFDNRGSTTPISLVVDNFLKWELPLETFISWMDQKCIVPY